MKSIKFRPILPPRPTLLLVSFQSYGLCKLDLFPSSELGTTAASENFRHMSRSTFPTQPTQLFSIVLALINLGQRVQDIPLEELEVPMVADKVTKMDAKMVIKSIFRV